MPQQIVTTVDAKVAAEREADLLEGYRRLIGEQQVEGLLRTELLRGQGGMWRIHTTWRDKETLLAQRQAGKPPAALRLLESVGAEHTHSWFVVEAGFEA